MLRSDAVLQRDVAAELAGDLSCRTAGIGVAVHCGVVTLTGIVPSASVRAAAICAVKRVFGVDGVDAHFELEHSASTQAVGATVTPAPSV